MLRAALFALWHACRGVLADERGGGAPQPFSAAFQNNQINSLRYNTSQAGSPVYIVYGTQRITINLIEGWGITGLGNSSKGGKGLGGAGGKKGGSQNYTANVAFALCEGPVSFTIPGGLSGYNRVWSNGSVAGANKVGLNYYTGTDGQAADPVFTSSDPNTPVLNYSGTAYVTGTPIQLGSAPALPSIQFEVGGFGAGTTTPGASFTADARPDFIVIDLLTSARYGAGFPIANIDCAGAWNAGGSLKDWGLFCQAYGLVMSPVLDRVQPCARWIEEWCQLTVSAPVWCGTTLKIIPYGDSANSGNGASWTPNLTVQYSFTDNDFLRSGGDDDPVVITRADPAQMTNWLTIEYDDQINSYNPQVIPTWDQGLIDLYGVRSEPPIQAHEFTNPTTATSSLQLMLQRKAYIRNTYKFKLPWLYFRLEPMDIVELTDANLGLNQVAVRITGIDEDDNGELAVSAEEIPGMAAGTAPIGVGTVSQIPNRLSTAGTPTNFLADPGNANVPVIFEPPSQLTGGVPEVWLITSGGSNWGGCQVWISTDGNTYALATGGTIYAGARQGVLSATLPSGSDPDITNTLSVDLTESLSQLLSGTQADADNHVTLCYVDGELISYETATLTAAHKYNLTYLRRGVYGSTISSHANGAQFCRFGPNDPSIFKYQYPQSFVGQTVFVKLLSFNMYGQALQALSAVSATAFILTGAGAQLPPFPVSGFQNGTSSSNAVLQRFAFCSSVVFPNAFGGSQAAAATAATAQTTYLIKKNGTQVGTMVFAAGASTGSFTSTSSSTAFNGGDELTVVAPASPDATLAGITWTLAGFQGAAGLVAETHGYQNGTSTSNKQIGRWIFENPVTITLSSSVGLAGTAATASTTYALAKNGSSCGTMTWAASGTSASFASAGGFGNQITFNPGDVLTVVAPASPDATLADIAWAISGANQLTSPEAFVEGQSLGTVSANQVIYRYVFSATMIVPAGSTGELGSAGTAGVGSTAFTIAKNGTTIGTMTFGAGATTATFSVASDTTYNIGDVMTITAPASPDGTLANLAWAIDGRV